MTDALFWIFSVLMLASGVGVVLSRNPINSAMSLVFGLFCMAGIFVLLEAFFLAAVQVLVYAGAVMVLFLFVIMLLDLTAEEKRKIRILSTTLGVLVVVGLGWELFVVFQRVPTPTITQDTLMRADGTVEGIGRVLFTQYQVPFEVTSLLLLAAMIGVILLSRRETP
jgi:NADH-quinone oxidoreductase subunit J